MMRSIPGARRGEHLETWASRAEASPVSELRGFAKGLRRDWAAVTNGLTLHWNSGKVEGTVNKIILWNQSCQVEPVRSAAWPAGH